MKIAALLSACLLASCTGIPRGWNEARNLTASAADPVSGAWSGEWRSSVNGHHGSLRCIASRKADGVWSFRYRASWARVFCAGFTLDASVQPAGQNRWTVTAKKDLGSAFGGVFRSRATVEGDTFTASYDSAMDRGTMTLRRVGPAAGN